MAGDFTGGQQPPRLFRLGRAEFGSALESPRGGGAAAAPLRLGGGFLQQRGHALVGFQCGCRQVPGVAVGLAAERVRHRQVGRGALGERGGVVDRCAYQRVAEVYSRAVYPDQARVLGRGERHGGQTEPARGRLWAVSDGGEQQRLPDRRGQGAVLGGDDGSQPLRGRQRLAGPPPPSRRISRDHLGQLDERHRVAGCLLEHLLPGPPVRRVRLGIEEPCRVLGAQRFQPQFRVVALEPRGRSCGSCGQQQRQPFGFQPPYGKRQRVQRGGVNPLRVVDHNKQRAVLCQQRKQGEHGEPGQQRIGGHRIGGQRERTEQCSRLPVRQGRHLVQHWPQQLVQAGERQVLLGVPAGRGQHSQPGRPGLPFGIGQQDGLAHPCLTQQHQHLAARRGRIHKPPQPGQLTVSADELAAAGQTAKPLTPSRTHYRQAGRPPQKAKYSQVADTARLCHGAGYRYG